MKLSSITCPSIRTPTAVWFLVILFVAFSCDNLLASRKALVIGNSRYTYVNFLPNPTRDADLIERVLSAYSSP